jgi:hypothetical protein
MITKTNRTPGYYWVMWSTTADQDVVSRRPAPLVGEWDGDVWWFSRMQAYQFDCDVMVMGELKGTNTPETATLKAAA